MPKQELILYRPPDADDRDELGVNYAPTPYRPRGLAAFFAPQPTIEDDTRWYTSDTACVRAEIQNIVARIDLGRTKSQVRELPVTCARDAHIRELHFEDECLRLEYRREQTKAGISQAKAEARKADAVRARADHEIAQYRQKTAEQSIEHESSAFAEELKAGQQMRRRRDDARAAVKRSKASAAEKEIQINEINALYERHRMEEE